MRWYLRYSLSYRDLEELMRERGLSVDHLNNLVEQNFYAPIQFLRHIRVAATVCRSAWFGWLLVATVFMDNLPPIGEELCPQG